VRQVSPNPMRWSADALDYSASSRHRITRLWHVPTPKPLRHGHVHSADDITLDNGRRVTSLGCDGQHRNVGVLDLEDLSWNWLPGPPLVERPRQTRPINSQHSTRPNAEHDEDGWR
jgi:hypothetical protein